MAYRNLEISNRGAVRTIVVNRPDKLNALNRDTLNELTIAFTQAAQDDAVRVVVLTGAGEKAFVAGADIAEMNGYTPVQAQGFSRAGQRLMTSIERLGKPVIARVQGFALGGGMELAMACHLRVASEKAKFGQPEINLGLIPGFGGTQRLLRLAGRGAALELCLTGAPINAQRAYELGLVTRVVAPEALDEAVNTLADQLAEAAPLAAAGILDAVLQGGETAIDQGLEFETQGFALAFSTEDMREGTTAFLEKRKAEFKGR
ncbi:enoyl-CoA hydratase/isomerase family protein [Rhodanobacter sp. B2A1Ga4]|uniref:enoyl-CoA hydratase/isomerase family protein n=1 Tax=Rhodanobacter TaxID=75309 RepID=UPI000D3D6E9A|nr:MULTISPECIES: enoyl-CoA hydratase-related protein [Rhodanobacter]MBQ4853134.1 enoyl-CoA hydratase/isomerase family protein [Rhodanobacter sp. B2A1Ga4]